MTKKHGCCAPGFSPQEDLLPPSSSPPQALLHTVSCLGNLPRIPCLPSASHAFLASLLWEWTTLPPLTIQRKQHSPGSPTRAPASVDHLEPQSSPPQRSVRAVEGARPRTKCTVPGKSGLFGVVSSPHPTAGPASTVSFLSSSEHIPPPKLRCFWLLLPSCWVWALWPTPTKEPRNGHAVETFRGAHQ